MRCSMNYKYITSIGKVYKHIKNNKNKQNNIKIPFFRKNHTSLINVMGHMGQFFYI